MATKSMTFREGLRIYRQPAFDVPAASEIEATSLEDALVGVGRVVSREWHRRAPFYELALLDVLRRKDSPAGVGDF